ncbi:TVP38/TMEM64 family protein [Shouchella patagoniensis]|uniref:TVP38/TMEM64 family protein n=1 Tax=Shouchella patagoniensis TaxID=228576 RepID=UPI0009952D1F|nr:TVP38/TMEM64 family protein [Shouchella patagoniensis]
MEDLLNRSLEVIELAGWYAPVLFVFLHVLRPFLFLPVMLVCVAGGYVFGPFYGAVYSYLGLMGVSISFYWLIGMLPKFHIKLARVKDKMFNGRERINVWQLLIFRIMPFMHFHALSFYVMEETENYKQYVRKSAIINSSPAIIYTAFGGLIHQLPLSGVLIMVIFLLVLIFLMRTKHQDGSFQSNGKFL